MAIASALLTLQTLGSPIPGGAETGRRDSRGVVDPAIELRLSATSGFAEC